MDVQNRNPPGIVAPLGLAGTTLLYGGAGMLLYTATHWIIPAFAQRTHVEPVVLWFVVAGLIVFVPLVLTILVLLHQEKALGQPGMWRERLRFRRMSRADWAWSFCGLLAIALLGLGTLKFIKLLWGEVSLHPSFMKMQPLTSDRYWILAAWLPFWIVNIMGEEILWRGVVLPRHEAAFGRWAWLVNGAAWLLFHLPMGPAIFVTLAPTTFILPYVAQRTKNSWTGVVIHAGLNGPGFIAVAFGFT